METSGYTGSAPAGPETDAAAADFGFFAPAPAPVDDAAATPEEAPADVVEDDQQPTDLPAAEAAPASEPAPAETPYQDSTPDAAAVDDSWQAASAPTPAVLLESPAEEPVDAGPLGGSLPMSLAIAADEASRVALDEPEPPARPSYEEYYGQDVAPTDQTAAPTDTTTPEPTETVVVADGSPPDVGADTYANTYSDMYTDSYAGDGADGAESGVGLMDTEAEESGYHRTSTEVSLGGEEIVLADLLIHVLESGASDLHLTAGARPAVRLHGHLEQMQDFPVLTPPVIQRIMYAAITQKQREKFEEELELDFAYSVPGRARFRVNLYRQRDALGAAFRLIPFEIKRLEELGVPPQVANFANIPRGMVLVTGPTGSGKSTTLASIVDLANRTRKDHIMTCEDPIEFLHRHQQCIVNQREVGEDTRSFANALKHVLRQDPDIILVGEMRDLETISIALTAAETGHLVFATLHTQDAAQTIDRMIDAFPPHQQQQVRTQLAGAIQGVVCQTLCRTADGKGRQVAVEVMVATPAVRNLIREGKTHQIYSSMQAGAKHGMQTMDQHLADLCNKGRITYEVGMEKCHHIEDFNRLTGRG